MTHLRASPGEPVATVSAHLALRDEAQYLRRTLDNVAAQSVTRALWVVVDDGSTDETPAILKEYARRFPYPREVRRTAGAPAGHSAPSKDERAPPRSLQTTLR